MSQIKKATLAKEINGEINYIYPKTTTDMVQCGNDTLDNKIIELNNTIDALNTNIKKLQDAQNKKYELIETITISENGITTINRNKELDDTPYNFSSMLILGNTKISSASTQIRIKINDKDVTAASWMQIDSETWQYAELDIRNGFLFPTYTSSIKSYSAAAVSYSNYPFLCIPMDAIRNISIYSLNSIDIPLGSSYSVYAVRNLDIN